MARTRIKICGIRDAATSRIAADAGADLIGLVFAEASPRRVTPQEARAIRASLPSRVEPVALFVDHPVDSIRSICESTGITTVQLHGQETPEVVEALRPLRVIKALSAKQDDWVSVVSAWKAAAPQLEAVLCDAPPPPDAAKGFRGGHGQAFDWNALAAAKGSGLFTGFPPLFLAGGLTPDNVALAIRTVHPDAVDVSSGVESARGIKDPTLIRLFCDAVRQLE